MTGKQFAKVLKSAKYNKILKSYTDNTKFLDSLIEKFNLSQFCIDIFPWTKGKPLLKIEIKGSNCGYISFCRVIDLHGINKLIEILENSDM